MASKLRIGLVAPLAESVPPKMYGGTERVVSYLSEALVCQGHEVTLFASADSDTSAHLVPCSPRALRLDENCEDPLVWHLLMLEKVYQRIDEFDILHSNVHYLTYSAMRRLQKPLVSTMHGRMDIREYGPLYDEFGEMPLVSISYSQRRPVPAANWVQTIYHGLPEGLYTPSFGDGKYLAFLGRISPEKRVDSAIQIAKRVGMPLKVAAKIDNNDRAYFEAEIEPMLDDGQVEFVGEIGESDKAEFLGNAAALIFMIDWPEPFGLAMIEAMACGTPVIARRRGSISEVVDHGVSGFVCEDEDEAVEALKDLDTLSRQTVRETFERRFSAGRMARDYVTAYREVMLSYHSAGLDDARHFRTHHRGEFGGQRPGVGRQDLR
ncbi:MAG: glycosyltransferase family 4 protein [Persicimonas sp.]